MSSDVCSSDLALKRKAPVASSPRRLAHGQADFRGRRSDPDSGRAQRLDLARGIALSEDVHRAGMAHAALGGRMQHGHVRSEEHTSELQSLMRISYAVFCLTKNTQKLSTKITEQ